MDIRRTVGDNIRGYRHKKNYTQEKLAVLSGLHINYISSVERGERNLGIVNLVKIAKALRIPSEYLLIPRSHESIGPAVNAAKKV
ncbi:MAG: helix-turn-helix transcriptional regulator [Bacteroidota bacterium]|nr:helix-turn-helix transcriptional regulator [Bacteroidota bacterium]MDP4234352.1 helix-turn-helix transcriptional regulator [Bacteroidota bacterium]MDP4287970.1 helix-turn-helix transcriptional regulator [Bacteroidota bacterium]